MAMRILRAAPQAGDVRCSPPFAAANTRRSGPRSAAAALPASIQSAGVLSSASSHISRRWAPSHARHGVSARAGGDGEDAGGATSAGDGMSSLKETAELDELIDKLLNAGSDQEVRWC